MSFATKGKENVIKFETKRRVKTPDENYLPRRGPTLEIVRKVRGHPPLLIRIDNPLTDL